MLKRGRAAAAQPGAGGEGVKEGEAEHPSGRAAAGAGGGRLWGQGTGVTCGLGGQGTGDAGLGPSSARARGWLLGCRSSITLKWQPSGGTWTLSPPPALRVRYPSSAKTGTCCHVCHECPVSKPGRDGGPRLPPRLGLVPSKDPVPWEGRDPRHCPRPGNRTRLLPERFPAPRWG